MAEILEETHFILYFEVFEPLNYLIFLESSFACNSLWFHYCLSLSNLFLVSCVVEIFFLSLNSLILFHLDKARNEKQLRWSALQLST